LNCKRFLLSLVTAAIDASWNKKEIAIPKSKISLKPKKIKRAKKFAATTANFRPLGSNRKDKHKKATKTMNKTSGQSQMLCSWKRRGSLIQVCILNQKAKDNAGATEARIIIFFSIRF